MQKLIWFEFVRERGNWTTTVTPGSETDVRITQTGTNSFLLRILDKRGYVVANYNFPTLKAAQGAVDMMQDIFP